MIVFPFSNLVLLAVIVSQYGWAIATPAPRPMSSKHNQRSNRLDTIMEAPNTARPWKSTDVVGFMSKITNLNRKKASASRQNEQFREYHGSYDVTDPLINMGRPSSPIYEATQDAYNGPSERGQRRGYQSEYDGVDTTNRATYPQISYNDSSNEYIDRNDRGKLLQNFSKLELNDTPLSSTNRQRNFEERQYRSDFDRQMNKEERDALKKGVRFLELSGSSEDEGYETSVTEKSKTSRRLKKGERRRSIKKTQPQDQVPKDALVWNSYKEKYQKKLLEVINLRRVIENLEAIDVLEGSLTKEIVDMLISANPNVYKVALDRLFPGRGGPPIWMKHIGKEQSEILLKQMMEYSKATKDRIRAYFVASHLQSSTAAALMEYDDFGKKRILGLLQL
jgi:hypothetical protein